MRYRIFPPIGIARLGNDESFFLEPETPGAGPGELQVDGTVRRVTQFKNAGADRIRKQGARFHLFESDDGVSYRPAQLPAEALVTWKVTLENKKSGVTRPANPPTAPQRPQVPVANVAQVIRGGTKTISGANAASEKFVGPYEFPINAGAPYRVDVELGQLRTDAQGRLIVLGGKLMSSAPPGTNIGGSYFRNPGWHDDVSDGPVTAEIVLAPGTPPVAAEGGAWVIVAPPDYAPDIGGIVTLFDVLRQVGIDHFHLAALGRPSFDGDISPMITSARRMRWVHASAIWSDPVLTSPNLRRTEPQFAAERRAVRDIIVQVEGILQGHTSNQGPPFELRSWQKAILERWVNGDFDTAPVAPEADFTSAGLTRAALSGAVGQGFCPGIEAGILLLDPTLYLAPFDFRIDHDSVGAGELTALMAQPWQADFLKCNTDWWPTQRPDLAPQAVGAPKDWARQIGTHKAMVEKAPLLGFIVQQGANEVFVEAERGAIV